jgi:hypothetical protein
VIFGTCFTESRFNVQRKKCLQEIVCSGVCLHFNLPISDYSPELIFRAPLFNYILVYVSMCFLAEFDPMKLTNILTIIVS